MTCFVVNGSTGTVKIAAHRLLLPTLPFDPPKHCAITTRIVTLKKFFLAWIWVLSVLLSL